MRRRLAWMLVLLCGSPLARAGVARSQPPIQVTPPVNPPAAALVTEDVPGPPREVIAEPARVELPEIPEALRGVAPATPPSVIAAAPAVPVSARARGLSIDALNRCHAALAAKRYPAAIEACRTALAAWRGNHLAWYGIASAHVARRDWAAARAALAGALALRPGDAMYQQVDGIAAYRLGELDAARAALDRALAIEPALWRAHFFRASVDRDQHALRSAAEQLTAAIHTNPGDRASYVALCELYRAADQLAPALAVATLGTRQVAGDDAATLWLEVALVHDALDEGVAALRALDRAVELRPGDASLKLARARLYFERGERAAARKDLVAAASSADPTMVAARDRARQLLADLGSERVVPEVTSPSCGTVRACPAGAISNLEWMGGAWGLALQQGL